MRVSDLEARVPGEEGDIPCCGGGGCPLPADLPPFSRSLSRSLSLSLTHTVIVKRPLDLEARGPGHERNGVEHVGAEARELPTVELRRALRVGRVRVRHWMAGVCVCERERMCVCACACVCVCVCVFGRSDRECVVVVVVVGASMLARRRESCPWLNCVELCMRRHGQDGFQVQGYRAVEASSGSNVIPRRVRPGLAGLRPHSQHVGAELRAT